MPEMMVVRAGAQTGAVEEAYLQRSDLEASASMLGEIEDSSP